MKTWCKILPFFIVEWLAKRNCKKFLKYDLNNGVIAIVKPFENIEIDITGYNHSPAQKRINKWRKSAIKTSIDYSKLGDKQ